MKRLLLIKTSSLGDVVHNMPAVRDIRRAWPEAHIAWAVEDAFAPLVGLHPDVDEVIPVALRRWRRAMPSPRTWSELGALRLRLKTPFDAVIDTQGLVKSALVARLARGPRHGYDRASIREPLASRAYDRRHAVSRDLHAIDRNRLLCAAALGHALDQDWGYGLAPVPASPDDQADAGPDADRPYAVLLHGTAQARKLWPEAHWQAVGEALAARGLTPVLPWGTADERARADRLAGIMPGGMVPERAPLDRVARMIGGARLVVAVDTGLAHLAAALRVPLVSIFGPTRPALVRPRGRGPIRILGGEGAFPDAADVVAAIDTLEATSPAAPAGG